MVFIDSYTLLFLSSRRPKTCLVYKVEEHSRSKDYCFLVLVFSRWNTIHKLQTIFTYRVEVILHLHPVNFHGYYNKTKQPKLFYQPWHQCDLTTSSTDKRFTNIFVYKTSGLQIPQTQAVTFPPVMHAYIHRKCFDMFAHLKSIVRNKTLSLSGININSYVILLWLIVHWCKLYHIRDSQWSYNNCYDLRDITPPPHW